MSADHYDHPYPYAGPGAGYPPQPGPYPGGYSPQDPGQAADPHPGHYAWAPAPAPGYGYPAAPVYGYPAQQSGSAFNLSGSRFLRGVLIGAAATYLLTNENVQRTAIKGAVKAWSLMQGGVEELKERFQDAEAEMRAAEAGKER